MSDLNLVIESEEESSLGGRITLCPRIDGRWASVMKQYKGDMLEDALLTVSKSEAVMLANALLQWARDDKS